MNRFVSLLLVALCLVAVSLAQPAHAQWKMGTAYYPKSNNSNSGTYTTVNASVVGVVTVTATPINNYMGYTTSGSYSGQVSVDFTWTGNSNTPRTSVKYNETDQSTGQASGSGGSNLSNAGFLAYGSQRYGNSYDSGSQTFTVTDYSQVGSTTVSSYTVSKGIGASAQASYPSTATATAKVSFSAAP